MKLLLDIGNTRISMAEYDCATLSAPRHIAHAREWQQCLNALELPESLDSIWASSVCGPDAAAEVDKWMQQRFNTPVHWVRSQKKYMGLTCAYAQPERLGADRWLAMLAAWHKLKTGVIVVDVGTALTIDVIDDHGQHLGGLISPGVNTMQRSLVGQTHLPEASHFHASAMLGANTEACIANGTLNSAVGAIERVLSDYSGACAQKIVTGGEADWLASHLAGDWQLIPDLVLQGLAIFSDQEKMEPVAGIEPTTH